MKVLFRLINKNMEIITSDSGETTKTDGDFLPRGTIALFTGKIAGMVIKEKIRKDKLGR